MFEELCNQVASIDLTLVMDRVRKDTPVLQQATLPDVEKEYRRFLILAFYAMDKFPCRPPPQVDSVWHAHLLFTRKYFNDCHAIGKQFLHHEPETAPTEQILKDNQRVLAEYQTLFKERAPSMWEMETSILTPAPLYRTSTPCRGCG